MRPTLLFLAVLTCLSACGDKPDDTGPDGTEGDADADADADTDTDADADSDADTDTTGDCALNSGWPCSCSGVHSCDDGSDCIGVHGLGDGTSGYCAPNCTHGDHHSCPSTAYTGTPYCALSDGTNYWCVLICHGDTDCPSDQTCQAVSGGSLCYP